MLQSCITRYNFFKKKLKDIEVLFVTPLTPLFWTSGDVCPVFQSQAGCPQLHALSPACNGIRTFTSGATPTDLLVVNMAVALF